MRTRAKRTYKWRNAVERLQYIRSCIEHKERLLHTQEWAVTKTKGQIGQLEVDRLKVQSGLVRRP